MGHFNYYEWCNFKRIDDQFLISLRILIACLIIARLIVSQKFETSYIPVLAHACSLEISKNNLKLPKNVTYTLKNILTYQQQPIYMHRPS